jgi:uncharacterized protein YqjF (DUF2071 family)
MPGRPLLTAHWNNLLLLNFSVPTGVIARLAPPGTEPDLHDGGSYLSVVGFRFQNVRLVGLPCPGHTSFPEINLRYYVRRIDGNEIHRGVVFAREIVPRRAVALLANRLYNENYIARPMRSEVRATRKELAPGDTVDYAWKPKVPLRSSSHHWNRLAARVAAPLAPPNPASLDEFFVEHYWGYVRGRDGRTREYRVAHNPWRVAPVDNVIWDCDIASTYESPLAEFLSGPPASALIAEGSAIQLFRGQRV